MTVFVASTAFTPAEMRGPVALAVENGKVHSIEALTASADVDLRPWRIAPGYVDLHTHGFAGYDVTTGTSSDIAAMAARLPSTGVTAFLPTIASSGPSETLTQIERIVAAMSRSDRASSDILGIRLEGPFISRAKKGAQDPGAIRPPDIAEVSAMLAGGTVRIMDFAPEEDDESLLLAALTRHGVVASIGHTLATYEQARAAIDGGARHCTHLFNAMLPLEHRAPGAAGAVLTDTRVTVEMIADGVHLHPAMLKLIMHARDAESVALVTDAMHAAGMSSGRYTFLGRPVVVRDGAVRLADGTLAGSVLTLDRAVRTMVELAGATWSEAIRMATLTPARIVGAADRNGRLEPGANADFVVLDDDGMVRQTYIGGELIFSQ